MDEPEEVKMGAPAWMATFADLMSLLMCFFVMLLSFAEMDALKFKQVAESLERAFGVQREVKVIEVPMGTSPDLTHFSPGKPEPTSQDTVKQHTSEDLPSLETFTGDTTILQSIQETVDRQIELTQKHLEEELSMELMSGQLQIERVENRIIVRIEEKGSFPSGSADIASAFAKSLERIANAVASVPGDLSVEGHSDDIPMRSARFRSNWELSSSRAAVVAGALLQAADIPPTRVRVQGFAETRPRVPNDSTPNRALNRRVEVVIDLMQSVKVLEQQIIELIDGGRPDLVDDLGWE